MKMMYFERVVVVKDYQGRFHKGVYVPQLEFFKSNNEKFIANCQKGKKIKFTEASEEVRKRLRKLSANTLYSETEKLSNSEIYWRNPLHK